MAHKGAARYVPVKNGQNKYTELQVDRAARARPIDGYLQRARKKAW